MLFVNVGSLPVTVGSEMPSSVYTLRCVVANGLSNEKSSHCSPVITDEGGLPDHGIGRWLKKYFFPKGVAFSSRIYDTIYN